jgi:hypothetical protein
VAHARCPGCKTVSDFVVTDEDIRRRERYKEDEDGYFLVDLCRVCGFGGIERSIDQGGYFNRELPAVRHEWPPMGRLCSHCNLRIPRFLQLTGDTEVRARSLARGGEMIQAIKLVNDATGCGLNWARLWSEPREPQPWPGPPCIYCGEPLRSELAKQCLECGMDWHDPDNVRKL